MPLRLGVVSFVNTLPLIDGLDELVDVELQYTVPSLLLDKLMTGESEVALCSSIDYQRAPEPLVVVPCGLLGCAGSTLTVRLYSTEPIDRVRRVHCDTDSHTSVVLLQILMREMTGAPPRPPELIDFDAREHVAENRPLDWPDAMLLIGDKVVTDSPPAVRYPYQLDLGAAWYEHTGLPFVFALWMARQGTDPKRLAVAAAILDRQRRHNRLRLDRIIHGRVRARGWPLDLATSYLRDKLDFELTRAHRQGLELFFDRAVAHGLIERRRPLKVFDGAVTPCLA